MRLTEVITQAFRRFLPSPFTFAVLLTLFTLLLAIIFSPVAKGDVVFVLKAWESGIWNPGLLVFAYQMMLILVLGHVLVLSKPLQRIIMGLTQGIRSTSSAAVIVVISTMLVSFFNWGLGLIFGAILARKVGEHAQKNNLNINYPLIGACGYSGLMVWHGGISGSAPLKVAESGHLQNLLTNLSNTVGPLPETIPTAETILSVWNLLIFGLVVLAIALLVFFLGKKKSNPPQRLESYHFDNNKEVDVSGAERLEYSKVLAWSFGVLILSAFVVQYSGLLKSLNITPNMLNLFMLGLAIVLHGSFKSFLKAVNEAIKDTSGILIQFPLYFGIMGVMAESGLIQEISDFFVSVSTEVTLPVYTFFSAGLVNLFVPSGGGQWAIQGPLVVESALKLGVPLPKAIMALAYGDQVTNMLQPFWALPLLGITQLKAKEILPYTLIFMLFSSGIFLIALLLL